MTDKPLTEFEQAAGEEHGTSIWRELGELLWEHKSWWLAPIVLALALLGMLLAMAGSAAAPLLYPFL